MTVHAYAGVAYPTADAAFLAEVSTWLTADGLNDAENVSTTFASKSDEALADELLSDRSPDDKELDRDDVIAAFAKLRAMDAAGEEI